MTRFEVLAMLHGIGVIAWLGGGVGSVVLHVLALRARDYDELKTVARQSKDLGVWLFGPASMLTAVTGIALVATEEAFGFLELWIILGYIGIISSPLIQATVAERARQRLVTAMSEGQSDSPDSPEVGAAARSLTIINTIDIAILLVVLWAMYTRPGA